MRCFLHRNFFLALALGAMFATSLFAATEAAEERRKASTQQIGGLLFDVDEGVKVEQGPGGSVYMKSNREFMQDQFKEMDKRLENLEDRVGELESILEDEIKMKKETEAKALEAKSAKEGKRVLTA